MYGNIIYQVGTVTVAASGDVTVNPVKSNQAYTNVSVVVVPLGTGPKFRSDLFLNGVLVESNDYTDGSQHSPHFINKDDMFPPNINVGNYLGGSGYDPALPGFSLVITNNEATPQAFTIYSTFEALSTVSHKMDF